MNENKTTTYGDLKMRKAKLREEMLEGNFDSPDDYHQTLQAIKDAESSLLWGITPEESYGELAEQVRRKKCRTGAIVCFIVAGIAAVILAVALFGCGTLKGATSDTAWMFQKLSDNINVNINVKEK